MKKNIIFMLLVTFNLSSINIIDKPISFSLNRKKLTLDYIKSHYDKSATSIEINPEVIVIHYTASGSFKKTFNYLNRETIAGSRKKIKAAGRVNVSSHFLVKRNGKIYRLMPETIMARHVIGLNRSAIGIENIGSNKRPLTKKQLKANQQLVKYLVKKYNIKYLIGHSEYRRFEASRLWQEKDKKYRTKKQDPGNKFMRALRKKVKKLKLKQYP